MLASNSAGNVLSQTQVLTVSAAQVAPAITQEPQDVQVAAGGAVTMSVTANGTPTPALQWQLSADSGITWANINGANGNSLSFNAAAGDNGRRYRVVATNLRSSATSRAALLTVTAPVSPLAGRSWTVAQSLEENTTATQITRRASAIDDAGRVIVLFTKSDGTRAQVYATRGTPGDASQAPRWSTPVPINGSTPVGANFLSITSAPGGDMVALWAGGAPCTATSYLTTSNCQYFYIARYRAATDTWDAPDLLTDSDTASGYQAWINDRGDLVFLGQSWLPGSAVGSVQRFVRLQAVFMRAAGETAFRRHILSQQMPSPFETVLLDMDGAGNLLMGAKLRRAGVADIVAYRGTVATGFGDPVSLEDSPANAELAHLKLGRSGQQVVIWSHPTVNDQQALAATSTHATDAFVSAVLPGLGTGGDLIVTDEGEAILHWPGGGRTKNWTARNGWSESTDRGITDAFFWNNTAVSRNGLVLDIDDFGMAKAYDLRRIGQVISAQSTANSRYLLGFANGSVGVSGKPLVAVNGVGFVDLLNGFITLPTTGAPQGVVHPGGRGAADTSALWGSFLK